ncbi:hypothetical protein [Nocardia sp. NBC_01388]|uniref:DUF7373 family lipoprotein n=1 Tax=Nocardia sp. NBC_01388 TaxID=2903596 RepID=UPI00324B41A2
MTGRWRISSLAAVFVATGLLAACSIAGTPISRPIDVRVLDVGPYPLTRHDYDRPAGSYGAQVEGMRMSAALVPDVQIDPMLAVGRAGGVLSDNNAAVQLGGVPAAAKAVLTREGMLVGYAVNGSDTPGSGPNPAETALTCTLLRFPDAAHAERAATELEAADLASAPDQNRTLTLTDYAAAQVHWRPGTPSIGAYLAHGEFVLRVSVRRPVADENDLLGWVRRAFDMQLAAVDKFKPTPAKDFAALRIDEEGMLARSMVGQRDDRNPDIEVFAVYSTNYLTATSTDSVTWQRILQDAGADAMSYLEYDTLFRVRDAQAGHGLVAAVTLLRHTRYRDMDSPAHVPDAQCLALDPKAPAAGFPPYKCYLAYGRYVDVLNDHDKTNILHRTAAEYALLADSF